MHDDLRVIERVKAGEVDAFRTLVKRYERSVFLIVKNLLPDVDDREDVAQETFLAAYANLAAYDSDRAKFSTWLSTIARNKCLNLLKRRRPILTDAVVEASDWRTPMDDLADDELHRRLDAALDQLPVEQRTAFVLAEFHELSYEEIGQIEGVKLGTVKSRISRAKEKLRRVLEDVVEPY